MQVQHLQQRLQIVENRNLALVVQLEASTGRVASEWEELPATPPDLKLPSQVSHSKPWAHALRRVQHSQPPAQSPDVPWCDDAPGLCKASCLLQVSRPTKNPTSAEQALKLIARLTALNRPTYSVPSRTAGSSPAAANSNRLYGRSTSDDVVQSVRRMRAERDQLRLRERDHARSMRQVSGVREAGHAAAEPAAE